MRKVSFYMCATNVDAVITWVDGNDPKLKAKHRKYFDVDESDDVTSTTRFADCNEIYYCISAIINNAPFINRIFIVTDDQVPPVIKQISDRFGPATASRISVIDHKEIFAGYEEFLPTFNSTSIESVLHRIPGLSDKYVYFNDDFIIAKPLTEEDFFVGNRPVLRGMWRKSSLTHFNSRQRMRMLAGRLHLKAKMFSYKEYQSIAFAILGFKEKFFWHDHTPHPFYRPKLEEYFRENESRLRDNLRFRIRDFRQYDTMSLANALDILEGNPTIEKPSLTYLKTSAKRFQNFYVRRKRKSFERDNSSFICIQALDSAKPEARNAIFAWVESIVFPHS
jgi:hypothetical protein